MLTRLEVDGFKNLLGFTVEFGPFTCIAGANAVGKSNLFDAIEFLSLLADHKLNEAASKIRAVPGAMGTGRELFWTNGVERAPTMSFAAEMIVDGLVFDELAGQPIAPIGTLLRYELELGYENGQASRIPRLVIVRERLELLGDADRIRFPRHPSFGETQHLGAASGRVVFDGASGFGFSPGRNPELGIAQRTVVSVPEATAERTTTLAARQEMRAWRRIALEPTAIAEPDGFGAPRFMSTEGRHLPTVLRALDGHVVNEGIDYHLEDGRDAYGDIAMRLSAITPIRSIEVDSDEERGTYALRVELQSGEKVPARALSAGTLRFLALAVLARDGHGLSCIEEPENGIHPFQIRDLVEILRELATDSTLAFEPVDDGTPRLQQVIVNTHSPPLVKEIYQENPEDILLATRATIRRPDGGAAQTLRLHPLLGTWRCSEEFRGIGPLLLAPYVGGAIRKEHE